MHFRKLPYHQKLFFIKDVSYCLEWLKTSFDAFSHTSRSPEIYFQKRYFWPSGVVKNVFWCMSAYFQNTRNFFKKRYFWTSGVVKNVFWCICAYFQTTRNFFQKRYFLPSGVVKTCSRPPETFFKKDIFFTVWSLKTCFDAFSDTSRSPEI